MKTYTLKYEPIEIDGVLISKWNVYYYDSKGNLELKENYSCDGEVSEIKEGYSLDF